MMLSVAQDWLSDPTEPHLCARAKDETLRVTGLRKNITKGGRTYMENQIHCYLQ